MYPLIMFFISLGMSSSLKDKYHVPFAKKKYGLTILGLWFGLMAAPWLVIIAWIFAKKTGILDEYRFKHKYEQKYQQNNASNPYYNSFATGNQTHYNNAPNTAGKKMKYDKNYAKTVSNPYDLPRTEAGRKKIITKFNEKYNLTLTKQDISLISSATYMSIEWASEVYSMERKYDSLYEWLGQGNSWLRVYLYVFNVQSISPVFNKQEELVFQAFNTIFSEMCVDDTLPIEVVIQNINYKYLTNFDEATFMMAINYMESKGKRYKYGSPVLTRMSSDIENLTRKYN